MELLSVFPWRQAEAVFEYTVESAQACKSGIQADIRDGLRSVFKKANRIIKTQLIQILIKICVERRGEYT